MSVSGGQLGQDDRHTDIALVIVKGKRNWAEPRSRGACEARLVGHDRRFEGPWYVVDSDGRKARKRDSETRREDGGDLPFGDVGRQLQYANEMRREREQAVSADRRRP